MIRIAIVEDEDSYVQVLTGYLKQYEEPNIPFPSRFPSFTMVWTLSQ
ncbi:MAG: hypothetical protein ACLTPG_08550 [Mediterraneibacter gnavus]